MSSIHSHIRPDSYLFLRLPSDLLKLIEIKPNTIIDTGRLGSFPANALIGRPYHYTYELLEKREGEPYSRLRIVPPSELNAEVLAEGSTPAESRSDPATPAANGVADGYDLLADDGTLIVKNNRLTIDDASRQTLSHLEIEELKRSAGGREIVEKILANHTGLDEKTAFAKAKYTLRKTKKYLKRFAVLPMTIQGLIDYLMEKEPSRILEMRQESLGLVCAWGNVHYSADDAPPLDPNGKKVGGGRWLVADETGGLLSAALAERLGMLYHTGESPEDTSNGADAANNVSHRDFPIPAATNSLTVLHPAVQPNLSLLKYFGYDTNQPDVTHPLHDHLRSLSYLQLLHPDADPLYQEPEVVSEDVMQSWKSAKRGNYYKKRRRWARCRAIVDETREGGFDSLVVASNMDPATILPCTVPLVRGGGHVVVYSPTVEPLIKLIDLFSKDRRTAYINHLSRGEVPDPTDFPLDPRVLLATNVQTSRVREWQVLPGRTHPLMTSPGGAEGFVFTARRVIPLDGAVEARGNFNAKKRKQAEISPATATTPVS